MDYMQEFPIKSEENYYNKVLQSFVGVAEIIVLCLSVFFKAKML